MPDSDVFNESGEKPASARKKPHAEEADEEDGRPAVTDDDRGDEPPADSVPAEAEVAPKRLPVPAKEAIAEAEKAVRELYKADYARRSGADRVALARKLLDQAKDTGDDEPATKYVLLREARDLAAAAGDVTVAVSAADELVAGFVVKEAETKLAAVPAKGAPAAESARALIAITEDAIAEEDWTTATKAASLAATAAGRVRDDKDLAVRARAQRGAVTRSRKLATAAAEARKTLATSPNDAKANLLLGRYLCLARRDWAAGVPHLAKSGDAVLVDPARLEMKVGADAKQMADVADRWWAAADKAPKEDAGALRSRAAYWYARAVPELDGVTKSLAEKRLAEVQQASAGRSVNLLPNMQAQGCKATPARDGVALTEGEHGRIVTPEEYRAPLTIEISAKVVGGSMRLYAGTRGICILNWDDAPAELRFVDPASGQLTALPAKGAIPTGQWVTIRWVIGPKESSIFVDGQQRARVPGDYSDWSGTFGIGPSHGSTVTVRLVTITAARSRDAGNR